MSRPAFEENRVTELVDHLFRHQSGRMVSVLVRLIGFDRIDAIEEAVQDSMVAALRKWPFTGVPENPTAWLIRTARNRMIDQIRRERFEPLPDDESTLLSALPPAETLLASELAEDELRMIFACCHPMLSPDSQVALTLKIVSGFSVAEIASAFLTSNEAVAKMLTRAKARLRQDPGEFRIPAGSELTDRLNTVLKSLYLIFNEGYGASEGDELVRGDLCAEAIRLTKLVAAHPVTACPKAHAAAALFLFQAARIPARTDPVGELVLFADQDRGLWDCQMIADGLAHFRLSADGDEISSYHLEAEIAAAYSLSPSAESIDRARILECYDSLRKISFSRVAELNRIVVVSMIYGPDAALTELNALDGLDGYNLFHLTRAYLLSTAGRKAEAVTSYSEAQLLTRNEAVRKFIAMKIGEIRNSGQAV
ncbi:MAG: RNA polymerase sigma factor [Pyrinomonadaceae bacterium]